jgi:hypothetical protein
MTEEETEPRSIPDQVREWLERLAHASGPERSQAARELSRLGVWSRGGIRTRGSLAISAPSRLPAPEEQSVLLSLLQDQDPELRCQVALALGEWGGEVAAAALTALIGQERDERVWMFCITALRMLGGPAALDGLHTLLLQGSDSIRKLALEAIEELATGGRKIDTERPDLTELPQEQPTPAQGETELEPGELHTGASAVRNRGALSTPSREGVRTRGALSGQARGPMTKVLAALESIRANPDEPLHLRERAAELSSYLG